MCRGIHCSRSSGLWLCSASSRSSQVVHGARGGAGLPDQPCLCCPSHGAVCTGFHGMQMGVGGCAVPPAPPGRERQDESRFGCRLPAEQGLVLHSTSALGSRGQQDSVMAALSDPLLPRGLGEGSQTPRAAPCTVLPRCHQHAAVLRLVSGASLSFRPRQCLQKAVAFMVQVGADFPNRNCQFCKLLFCAS